MVEAKVFEKIRQILINDNTVAGYVSDRVYTEHISSITDPVYPAISLHLLPGKAKINVPTMVEMVFQIDLWFPSGQWTADDVYACYGRIRTLLHRENTKDTSIGVTIMNISEAGVGPMMYDEAVAGYHLPVRYNVVAI
ncbi:MAG: hypothetical protein HY761_10045 [Candidatus Omnitrophica bacterium]|nr:hypothetical protein [Candidatus Omnitrophota bacterium]